jgi:hypothetical protein
VIALLSNAGTDSNIEVGKRNSSGFSISGLGNLFTSRLPQDTSKNSHGVAEQGAESENVKGIESESSSNVKGSKCLYLCGSHTLWPFAATRHYFISLLMKVLSPFLNRFKESLGTTLWKYAEQLKIVYEKYLSSVIVMAMAGSITMVMVSPLLNTLQALLYIRFAEFLWAMTGASSYMGNMGNRRGSNATKFPSLSTDKDWYESCLLIL